jgi:hypothetical protein
MSLSSLSALAFVQFDSQPKEAGCLAGGGHFGLTNREIWTGEYSGAGERVREVILLVYKMDGRTELTENTCLTQRQGS